MAVTFNSTVSDKDANSYASLQQILDYFETTNTTKYLDWKALKTSVQQIFAIAATKIINDHYDFDHWDGPTVIQIKDADGNITTFRQALPWPQIKTPINGLRETRSVDHKHHTPSISGHHFHDDQAVFEHTSWIRSFGVTIQGHKPLEFFEDTTIPDEIIEAQAEMALILARLDDSDTDIFAVPKGQNVILRKVDVITTQFSKPNEFFNVAEGVIKAEVWIKLNKFGKYIPNINTPGYQFPGAVA